MTMVDDGMFGRKLNNPFSALAMVLGPAMMAKGFDMPGLANIGPQMLQLGEQQRQAAARQAIAERELGLKEDAADREARLSGTVSRMFEPGVAGVPSPSSDMFGGLSEADRAIARTMALDDPMAALEFAAKRTAPAKAPAATTAMKEAEALGYEPGTEPYRDYIRQRAERAGIQVNVGPQGIDYGKPPSGMTWARDAEGKVALEADPATGFMRPVAVPIAGGPVEEERAKATEAKAGQAAQRGQTADIVTQDIDEVFRIMDESAFPVTGAWSMIGELPVGSPQRDVRSLLDSIRANVGFDKLQAMRAASPTGGALGQVSERENTLLQSALGSLEQSQTASQFRRNLQRVRDIYGEIVNPQISDLTDAQLVDIDLKRLSAEQLQEYLDRVGEPDVE